MYHQLLRILAELYTNCAAINASAVNVKCITDACPTTGESVQPTAVVQLWFELYRPPSSKEAELMEEVLASWFMLGRLGAYNTQNLQVR